MWDDILTYDKNDAEEFGWKWFGYTYYSAFDNVNEDIEKSDIYFVGYKKGNRERIIADIYSYLSKKDINCMFHFVDKGNNGYVEDSDLKYIPESYSYLECIKRVKSSNCILEVLQERQHVQSIRYFEAIVYNKKLLTNNPQIFSLPYYNEKYMHYFKNIDDIDWNWVKEKMPIDYKYQNEFSPIHLVDFIKKIKQY